jgi:hypothetical protein
MRPAALALARFYSCRFGFQLVGNVKPGVSSFADVSKAYLNPRARA